VPEPPAAAEPALRPVHVPGPREAGEARSSRLLVVAADLAFAGYTREQIGARLSALGDPDAAIAIDDAFE
jgi:hypothetical protein